MVFTVVVAIGTRPEAIKLAPVVAALRLRPSVRCRVMAVAQHRDLLDQVLEEFDVVPSIDLDLMRYRQGLNDLFARAVTAVDAALERERPDVVLVQGDTTAGLAASLAGFHRRVPIAHVEAGLRSGRLDQPFPEEMNRRVLSVVARLHFAPTAAARDRLLAEGVHPEAVMVTGNPVVDALRRIVPRVDADRWRPADGRRLVLVTAHRRENQGAPLERICRAVAELAARGDIEVLLPVHPNPAVSESIHRELAGAAGVRLVPALPYREFVAAMVAADLILSDSGGVQEEAPSLGKPLLVLRDVTERPEGIAAGVARLVGTDPPRIVAAATQLLDDPAARAAMVGAANPYGDGEAAERIAAAVVSHLERGWV